MSQHRQERKLLNAIARYQAQSGVKGPIAAIKRSSAKLQHMFWSTISASDIDRNAQIHPTVRLPHLNGVVMHAEARVDENCMIMQQVTLGQVATPGAPHIMAGAYIGAGAKVLGKITIGKNARIGANAVVLCDVPDNATAVGIPAKVISQDGSSGTA